MAQPPSPRSDEEDSVPLNLGARPAFPSLALSREFAQAWGRCGRASVSGMGGEDMAIAIQSDNLAMEGVSVRAMEWHQRSALADVVGEGEGTSACAHIQGGTLIDWLKSDPDSDFFHVPDHVCRQRVVDYAMSFRSLGPEVCGGTFPRRELSDKAAREGLRILTHEAYPNPDNAADLSKAMSNASQQYPFPFGAALTAKYKAGGGTGATLGLYFGKNEARAFDTHRRVDGVGKEVGAVIAHVHGHDWKLLAEWIVDRLLPGMECQTSDLEVVFVTSAESRAWADFINNLIEQDEVLQKMDAMKPLLGMVAILETPKRIKGIVLQICLQNGLMWLSVAM